MSFVEKDRYLSSGITDHLIAKRVSYALRYEHSDTTAALKQLERITGIKAITARKWYNGVYAPKSKHLLTMAAYYPEVLHVICELTGMHTIWQQAVRMHVIDDMRNSLNNKLRKWKKYHSIGDSFVTIQVRLDSQNIAQLNPRQLWFIGQLQQGYEMHIHDLTDIWHIHLRTAKRDISGLLKSKLIIAVKTGRSCRYELI